MFPNLLPPVKGSLHEGCFLPLLGGNVHWKSTFILESMQKVNENVVYMLPIKAGQHVEWAILYRAPLKRWIMLKPMSNVTSNDWCIMTKQYFEYFIKNYAILDGEWNI